MAVTATLVCYPTAAATPGTGQLASAWEACPDPTTRHCVALLLPARILYPLAPWRPAGLRRTPGLAQERWGRSRLCLRPEVASTGSVSLDGEHINKQMVGKQVRGDQERSWGGGGGGRGPARPDQPAAPAAAVPRCAGNSVPAPGAGLPLRAVPGCSWFAPLFLSGGHSPEPTLEADGTVPAQSCVRPPGPRLWAALPTSRGASSLGPHLP